MMCNKLTNINYLFVLFYSVTYIFPIFINIQHVTVASIHVSTIKNGCNDCTAFAVYLNSIIPYPRERC